MVSVTRRAVWPQPRLGSCRAPRSHGVDPVRRVLHLASVRNEQPHHVPLPFPHRLLHRRLPQLVALLDRDTVPGKAICSVYEARPMQCRTWPFWKVNLASRQAWESVKKATPCPGMGSGTLVSIERIRIQRDALP